MSLYGLMHSFRIHNENEREKLNRKVCLNPRLVVHIFEHLPMCSQPQRISHEDEEAAPLSSLSQFYLFIFSLLQTSRQFELGHFLKTKQQEKSINPWALLENFSLLAFIQKTPGSSVVGHIGRRTRTCRHRSYSGTSRPPLKCLSCGQACGMACTTNWSPLTEVSLWDCYIIAGKWRTRSLFNCHTVNPNAPIVFVAEAPLYPKESPIF